MSDHPTTPGSGDEEKKKKQEKKKQKKKRQEKFESIRGLLGEAEALDKLKKVLKEREHHDVSLLKKANKWAATTTGSTVIGTVVFMYFFDPDTLNEAFKEIASSASNLVATIFMAIGFYALCVIGAVWGLGKSWEAAKKPFGKADAHAGGGHAKPAH